MIRVLTVRQPYAWAIIHGGKDVENRSRNVAASYGAGPLAIHVSQTDDANAFVYSASRKALGLAADRAERGGHTPPYWQQQGFIIGVVDLVEVHASYECVQFDPDAADPSPICSPWAEHHMQHLVLANPRPLSEPMPYRGALHLQTMSPADEAELLRRLE